jgi:hypothetical protein
MPTKNTITNKAVVPKCRRTKDNLKQAKVEGIDYHQTSLKETL